MNQENISRLQNPPQLLNECRNCTMKFDNSASLANHVQKFCTNSQYSDPHKLEQRMMELGHNEFSQPTNINFQDVKSYLKGNKDSNMTQKTVGKMSLEDIRNQFQSENRKFEDIQKEGARRKEQELIADLGDLKKEKNFLRQQRTEQEGAMHDLIKELELKKDRELRAKIEKDEIQRALKEIENTKISALERDKRKELERLAAERENLRLKEEDVMDEIRGLEGKMYEKERAIKEQQDRKNDIVNNSEYYGKVMRRNGIEFAKERGEQIAALQHKKESLEEDRIRIMEDLDRVKNGDLDSLRKNEASRWVANDIISKGNLLKGMHQSMDFGRVKLDPHVKDKLVSDQARINHLKEQQEKMQREALTEMDELDAFAQKWGVPTLNNNNYANNRNQQQLFPNQSTKVYNQRYGDAGPYAVDDVHASQQLPETYKNKYRQQPLDSDEILLGRLRDIRQDYDNEGEGREEFYQQLDDIENHILTKDKMGGSPPSHQQPPQQQQTTTHIHHDMPPSFMAPPFMPPPNMLGAGYGGGMYPPGAAAAGQLPINFYPTPGYMQPPPPLPNGEQSIERYKQFNNIEPPPMISQPYLNPQIVAMNSLIGEQEQQNDILERELLALKQGSGSVDTFEQLLGNSESELNKLKAVLGKNGKKFGTASDEPFPEDFVFRQNEFRCEDLEVEERVIMNIAAQDFDGLRIMSKLPVNSELYRFKMDQYKEQSTVRAETEKVYQEQRLEKIRRDFEKQKYEDERKFKHDKWLEDQKRQILEAKLKNAARPKPQTPQQNYQIPQTAQSYKDYRPITQQQSVAEFMQPPMLQEEAHQAIYNDQDPNIYDPAVGFQLYFDFASRLQRQFRSMRIVYAVYNVSRSVVSPSLIDIHDSEPDPEDNDKNRIIFKEQHTVKNVQPHPSSNLILEFQVPKPQTASEEKFVSYGWTILNLFESTYDLNRGIYRIPIYMSPTRTDIDVRDIRKLKRIPDTVICVRLGNPGDENSRFQVQFTTSPMQYVIPRIHQFKVTPPRSPARNIEEEDLDIPSLPAVKVNAYECKGIHVEVHYVKQYMPTQHAKIQCTLFEGNQMVMTQDNKPCNWATKQIDGNSIMNTRGNNPLNAGMAFTPSGIARGEIIGVDDNTSWIRDFYTMQVDNGLKDDLNLVVQIMEYTGGRRQQNHEISSEYSAIGYSVLKINNQDGTIRYGTYELEFFKPPVNLIRRNQYDVLKQTIKLTIGQPHFTNARQLTVNPSQLGVDNKVKPQLQIEPNQGQQPQRQPDSSTNDRAFIPNQMKQYDDVRFAEGEGIDFYIDGCRFLPENATYSRVLMRAFTLDQYRVINATKGLADLNVSKGRHPFYGFRQEIRAPSIDPTMNILITIETIDRSDGLDKIVGYGYFALYLNGYNKQPVTERTQSNIILQSGAYQIPIYKTKIAVDKDVNLENIQSLEKIPCASILLRCYKAPVESAKVLSISTTPQQQWRQKGLIIDPPEYSQGVYNTTYCQVSQFESTMFDLKQTKPNPPMREVVNYVKKLKGRVMDMNDGDTLRWLDKMLVTNLQTLPLNIKFWSSYESNYGIRFGVDRLHNLSIKLPQVVITSIIPPGSLYAQPPRKSKDTYYFTDFDWNSPLTSIQFTDEMVNYTGLPPNSQLAFLIDIKGIKFVGEQIQLLDIGWSFLPIFDSLPYEDGTEGVYSNSSLTALPIWQGALHKDAISNALKSSNPLETLKTQKSLKVIDSASVICRIHDNQREFIPRKGYYGDIDNQHLPQNQLQKYAYNETNKRQTNNMVFSNVMPSGLTKESYSSKVKAALDQYYKL